MLLLLRTLTRVGHSCTSRGSLGQFQRMCSSSLVVRRAHQAASGKFLAPAKDLWGTMNKDGSQANYRSQKRMREQKFVPSTNLIITIKLQYDAYRVSTRGQLHPS